MIFLIFKFYTNLTCDMYTEIYFPSRWFQCRWIEIKKIIDVSTTIKQMKIIDLRYRKSNLLNLYMIETSNSWASLKGMPLVTLINSQCKKFPFNNFNY